MNDRWERLIDLYHSAVSLPADERATLLAEECGDDLALQADVERMIVAHHLVSRPTGPAPVVSAAPLPPPDAADTAPDIDPAAPPPEGDEPAPTGPPTPFPIVGVGASAGGMEAFTELLRHIPSGTTPPVC